MSNWIRTLCVCGIILTNILSADEQELLKKTDVHKVMQEIFHQHVDKKEMTVSILKNSLKVYIDQFDPDRVYLLESDVRPYLKPTDYELDQALEQYKRNDLSLYEHLNRDIQQSIERAQQIRKGLIADSSNLMQASKTTKLNQIEEKRDQDQRRFFAKTLDDLKARIRLDLIEFVQDEVTRFGQEPVMRDFTKTLGLYDHKMRGEEDEYLATDETGHALLPQEQENLFVMHVLKALAASLDAHTKVMDLNEAYDMKIRLEKEYQGIGVRLQQRNKDVIVSGFVPGSPAEKSGKIKPNDRVLEIDGHSIANEPFDRVMELIRNPQATSVRLKLERTTTANNQSTNQIVNVELPRTTITINEGRVESSSIPFGNGIIGVIKLHMFYQGENDVNSESDVRKAIADLDKKGDLHGLVLDLRDNTGGFLMQAVKVAGLFISSGVVVTSKYFNGEEHVYRDVDGKEAYEGPLVILTSKETASAAEIVTQALQDYGVAIVAGDEHTYGKGTIQSQTVTGNNSSSSFFKVTVGKYYTVSGRTPQLQGVPADVLVPSQFNLQAIGEEYLDTTVPPDTIPSEYHDKLEDIQPDKKSWFLKYYVPKIQSKQLRWRQMIPTLQKNSEERIEHNADYQRYLKQLRNGQTPTDSRGEDLQVVEATNIVKDMITLETSARYGENPTTSQK